jgi:SnoaL-like domain
MSLENVEMWRASIEDLRACNNEADWEGWLNRVVERWDPAIEWDASAAPLPDIGRTYKGRDAVAQFWRDWLAAWQTTDFEYELIDAGEQVVALVNQRMRGRSTGIEVALGEYAQIAEFRDGLMVHWKFYPSRSEALKAVGLE